MKYYFTINSTSKNIFEIPDSFTKCRLQYFDVNYKEWNETSNILTKDEINELVQLQQLEEVSVDWIKDYLYNVLILNQ